MRYYEREDELENELNRGALWAITYGDMMSYLMIFFMILFAFYSSKKIDTQFSQKAIEETFGKDTSVVSTLFSKNGIQQIAQVEISANKISINFSDPILFEPGSDVLKPTSFPHLRRLTAVFMDLPNPIQIEGHTDNRPLVTLLPTLLALRERCQARFGYARKLRVGAAGGISTPAAAAA
ncbi:MAG: flagellar motor protein MotB, partial [Elusimicrobiota bacterium]|nr:flagellar motor protein MotB [Elusimicrobiota bacterium]